MEIFLEVWIVITMVFATGIILSTVTPFCAGENIDYSGGGEAGDGGRGDGGGDEGDEKSLYEV